MRTESILLTDEQEQWLAEVTPKSVPLNVTRTLLEYYLANKSANSNWCVLPITNMEAYLGSSALSRMYLKKLNDIIRKKNISSVNAVTINHPTFIISSHTGDLT